MGITASSDHYYEALSFARSHLAAMGRDVGTAIQSSHGDDGGGFTWTTSIHEAARRNMAFTDQDRANGLKPAIAILYDVRTTERWMVKGREQQTTLITKRIGIVSVEDVQ
jgi:hypothetical protein